MHNRPRVQVAAAVAADVIIIGVAWAIWRVEENAWGPILALGLIVWTALWAAGVRKGRSW